MSTHLPDENTFAILKICNDSFIELPSALRGYTFKQGAFTFLTNYFYHTLKFEHSVKTKEFHYFTGNLEVSKDFHEEYLKQKQCFRSEKDYCGLLRWTNKSYSEKIINDCTKIDFGNIVQPVREYLRNQGYLNEESSYAGLCNELHRQRSIIKRMLYSDSAYTKEHLDISSLILKMIVNHAFGISKLNDTRNMIAYEILNITACISYNPLIIDISEVHCKSDAINTGHFDKMVKKYNLDYTSVPIRNLMMTDSRRWLYEEFVDGEWNFVSRGFKKI